MFPAACSLPLFPARRAAALHWSYDDVEVVGTAADGVEAVELADSLEPHVVLMDLSMPRMGGVDATREIVARHPDVQVVVLTSFSDQDLVLDAVGYLLKDAEPGELVRGVRAAAAGESPLDAKVARTLLARQTERSSDTLLSDREREVLTLVADGLANKQIARSLGISERIVKSHLTSVFQRIGVSDRTQAALWAERNGLRHADPS
jgi:DNA-binding NarL/FixJ family response regulator